MRYLITGNRGMIGTELSTVLRNLGHKVIGVDIKKTAHPDDLILDLREPCPFINVDCIIHLAAHSRVVDTVENPQLAMENILMTFNVLEYARKTQTKMIFASSREVYGNVERGLQAIESHANISNSVNPYAASKVACEALCCSYYKSYGTPVVILRFSNVYGKNDFSSRIIPSVIKHVLDNTPVSIVEDRVLDFIYIDDVIKAIQLVSESDTVHDTINVMSGESVSLGELTEAIKTLTYSDIEVLKYPVNVSEVDSFYANNSKMKTYGWLPKRLSVCIPKTIRYYKKNYNKYATQS